MNTPSNLTSDRTCDYLTKVLPRHSYTQTTTRTCERRPNFHFATMKTHQSIAISHTSKNIYRCSESKSYHFSVRPLSFGTTPIRFHIFLPPPTHTHTQSREIHTQLICALHTLAHAFTHIILTDTSS